MRAPNVSGSRAEWIIRSSPTSDERRPQPEPRRVRRLGPGTTVFDRDPGIQVRYVHELWGTATPWATVTPRAGSAPYQVQARWWVESCVGGSDLVAARRLVGGHGRRQGGDRRSATPGLRYFDASGAQLAHTADTWDGPGRRGPRRRHRGVGRLDGAGLGPVARERDVLGDVRPEPPDPPGPPIPDRAPLTERDIHDIRHDRGTASMTITQEQATWFAQTFGQIADNVERAVLGKRHVVELVLTAMLSDGHVLLEDVPGTGKTSLARAMAQSVQGTNTRIQFTPDLLPGDITGISVYDQKEGSSSSTPGPIFANIVLADEINRASPKTQSALLEVMEEGSVTIDGVTRQVGVPFLVLATQNPIEQAGTYRLPEAQLDRFMMRASLGYPDHAATVRILDGAAVPTAELAPIITPQALVGMADLAAQVYVDALVLDYVARLVDSTRSADEVRLGVSIRGALALTHAARTRAASQGRTYATPDDVKALAVSVLSHRLILHPEAEFDGVTPGGRHRPGAARRRTAQQARGRMSLTESRLTRTSAATGTGGRTQVTATSVTHGAPRARARARRRVVGRRAGARWARPSPPPPSGARARCGPPAPWSRSRRRWGSASGSRSDGSSGWSPARSRCSSSSRACRSCSARGRTTSTCRSRTSASSPATGSPARSWCATTAAGSRCPAASTSPSARVSSSSASRCCAPTTPSRSRSTSRPSRRGIVTVGPATTVRSDPIGLLRREHAFEDVHELYVHPRTTALPSTSAGLIRDLEGSPTRRLVDSDMSFHAIREYAPGDSRRQIHWKSTAKTGRLMVRQYEESRRSRMAVVLGVAEAEYADADEFELAVGCAASLGLRAVRDARDVAIVTGSQIPRVVRGRLRAITHIPAASPRTMLDGFSGVELLESTMPVAEVCRLDRRVRRAAVDRVRRRRIARQPHPPAAGGARLPGRHDRRRRHLRRARAPAHAAAVGAHGADRRHARRPLGAPPAGGDGMSAAPGCRARGASASPLGRAARGRGFALRGCRRRRSPRSRRGRSIAIVVASCCSSSSAWLVAGGIAAIAWRRRWGGWLVAGAARRRLPRARHPARGALAARRARPSCCAGSAS